tara:strand:- start:830 stop:1690 length:861 start_codon:yes stop_codon:yes gene_type:complete
MSKNIKSSPLNLIGGLIQAAGAYDWGGKRAAGIKEKQGEYDRMKNKFQGLDTSNLYSDVSNPYANMQNTMEDLTVNQQQAQFQAQQNQQNQANIMSNMKGAAGSSGVAGLAQAMANQGSQQAQRASASIGQQESANQKMAAQQAGQLQKLDRQGAYKADMTRRSGAEQSRQLEKDKVNTMFTMSANQLGTAKSAHQKAQDEMWSGVGNAFSLKGQVSDRRLKKNITKIGESNSGLNIYSFEYKNSKHGDGVFQGVMSDEIPQEAVISMGGYDAVNYGILDVEFKQI